MVADELRELGGTGLLGGQAGDRVYGGEGCVASLAVGASALDLNGLTGAGEAQVARGGDLDATDLGAAVADAVGAALERGVLPGQGLEWRAQVLLVALDDADVVGVAAQEVAACSRCVWSASLVTTVAARSATVSGSGWKRVVSPVCSQTSSWARTSPVVCFTEASRWIFRP